MAIHEHLQSVTTDENLHFNQYVTGGEGGIRTRGRLTPTPDFESLEIYLNFKGLDKIYFRDNEFFAPLQPSICVGLSLGCGNDFMHIRIRMAGSNHPLGLAMEVIR